MFVITGHMNAKGIRYAPKNVLVRHTITTFLWYHNHIIIFFLGSLDSPSRGREREEEVLRSQTRTSQLNVVLQYLCRYFKFPQSFCHI